MASSQRIRAAILKAVDERGPLKTVCPSEVARALWPKHWRMHMDELRTVAADLVRADRLRVTQRGKIIDLATAKGPIRFSAAPAESDP